MAPPRLVLELQPDGSLIAEFWLAGSRERRPISLDCEIFDIREALNDIKRRQRSEHELAAERERKAQIARHNRVWLHAAESHGQGPEWADKVIGPREREAPQGGALTRIAPAGAYATTKRHLAPAVLIRVATADELI